MEALLGGFAVTLSFDYLFYCFVGVLLGGAGLGALVGMRSVDVDQARATESRMEDVKRLLEGGQQPPAVRATEPTESAKEALLPASDSRVTAPTGT